MVERAGPPQAKQGHSRRHLCRAPGFERHQPQLRLRLADPRRCQLAGRARRGAVPARALRLRQDHAAAHRRRHRAADLRPGAPQRPRNRRAVGIPAAGKALDRPGVPGFRAVSASDHSRQCALRPDGPVGRRGPPGGGDRPVARRAGALRRVLSACAVRRRAAARRAGAGAGAASGGAVDGRAVLRPRFAAEGHCAGRNAGDPARKPRHGDRRHP